MWFGFVDFACARLLLYGLLVCYFVCVVSCCVLFACFVLGVLYCCVDVIWCFTVRVGCLIDSACFTCIWVVLFCCLLLVRFVGLLLEWCLLYFRLAGDCA